MNLRGRGARILALALSSALAPAAVVAGPDDEAGEEVSAPLAWHATKDAYFLRRVTEAATGRPVAGATVRLFSEVPHPVPGFGSPAATATSDAEGWVRIREGDLDATLAAAYGPPTWAYVEAAGLRPDALYDAEAADRAGEFVLAREDVALDPATDATLVLRDPAGRPVRGALVEWILGCGHTPAARQARTDAHGVAVLKDASPTRGFGQSWAVAGGFASRYLDDGAAGWQRRVPQELRWAPVIEGTLTTEAGDPVAGASIGAPDTHRGPWTVTDARGEFELVGVPPETGDIAIRRDEHPVGPESPRSRDDVWWNAPRVDLVPPGLKLDLRVPNRRAADPIDEQADDQEPEVEFRVVVEIDTDGWPHDTRGLAKISVGVTRSGDGLTRTAEVGEQGVALLSAPAGEYYAYACAYGGPRRDIPCSRKLAWFRVYRRAGTYVSLAMPAPRTLDVVHPRLDRASTLDLLVEGLGSMRVLPLEGAEESDTEPDRVTVLVPPEVALFQRRTVELANGAGKRTRVAVVDPRAGDVHAHDEFLSLEVAGVRVHARLADPDGAPIEGRLSEIGEGERVDGASPPETTPATEPDLATLEGEDLVFVAWPADTERFEPTVVTLASAVPGKGPIDLGEVRLPRRRPTLRVVGPNETRYEAGIFVSRGDRAATVDSEESPDGPVYRDAWHEPGLVVEGARVRLLPDAEHASVLATLDGPGPWTVRAPRGSLAVRPARADGAPVGRWTLAIDGERFSAEGDHTVARLSDGPHEAIVDVQGTAPVRRRFTVRDGGAVTWSPRLRTLPPQGR